MTGRVEPAGAQGQPAGFVMPDDVRVVLVTRQGCHLCEQAVELLDEQCPGQWTALDVDGDERLLQRYTNHVPVVFVDGRLLAYWTLDAGLLADALAGRPVPTPPPL